MPSAFEHGPTLTVVASPTANAGVIWSAANNLGQSTVLLGTGTLGISGDTDIITLTADTVTVAGTVAATTLTGNGAGVTALAAANITANGTLPALNGAALTALNGSNIASGTVPVDRLGSGSPGIGNYLRGDGSWQAVSGGAAISGTPANNQVAVWTDASTIEGDSEFTWTESVLTVKQGASGGASGYNAKLIVESNTHAGISILAPDNSEMNLTFASPSQSQLAGIVANYNSNSEYMSLVVAGVEVLKINDGYVDCLTQDKGLRVRQVLNLYTPSNGGAPEIFWTEGDGTGSANNMKYRMAYNGTSNNYFSFRSYDTNGSSADDDIWRVYDGTAELRLNNNLGSNFDKYDDALVLERHFSDPYRAGQDLIQESQDELIEMGILVKDSDGWIGQSLNRWVPLLAGGVYQTRQRVDNLYEELKAEIKELKAEIDELKG